VADTDGDRAGRHRPAAANGGPLIVGLVVAAVASLAFALIRAGAWAGVLDWLGRWWPAVVGVGLGVAALVLWRRSRTGPAPSEARWTRLTALVTALTAVAALAFTAQSLRATRDQIDVTEQRQLTDRYTKAIDQLGTPGADHLWVRVGGIFALERVAIDSPRDQRAIVEVLGAFIHTASPRPSRTAVCPGPRRTSRPPSWC
jgi:hypothetical protein